ncbi:MAG TPA: pilus assembly protein [Firmicutes bacterium]|nr:pilus assembly protein [Candidatus Fermentithermobacillaceae bacterium]
MKRLIRGQEGQAVVELALVLPILIFLLLVIMEGGRIFAGYVELQNAARDGARYAAIHCTMKEVPDGAVSSWVASTLTPWVQSRLTMLNPQNLSIEFSRKENADRTETWVEITLSYPMEIVTPGISAITGNPFNLRITMAMRNE